MQRRAAAAMLLSTLGPSHSGMVEFSFDQIRCDVGEAIKTLVFPALYFKDALALGGFASQAIPSMVRPAFCPPYLLFAIFKVVRIVFEVLGAARCAHSSRLPIISPRHFTALLATMQCLMLGLMLLVKNLFQLRRGMRLSLFRAGQVEKMCPEK